MMEPSVIFEMLVFYFFVIAFYRLLNRQQLRELTIADGLVFILTIQLMLEVIFYENQNVLLLIVPLIILIFLRPLLKYLGNTNLYDGKIVVIENGKINFKELIKTKYSVEMLLQELEEIGVKKIENVKLAYVKDGKLVIDKHVGPYSLIFNGQIDYQALKEINKTPNWLHAILKARDLELQNIYYSFYIDDKLYIIQKEL